MRNGLCAGEFQIQKTVCTIENTTESLIYTSNTFHHVVEELHINLKIDAVAMNRRRRRFCIRLTIYHIYQGQRRQCAGYFVCVHDKRSV